MFAAMNKQRFFRAAENGNYERLGALIQEEADVNVTNSKGDTALLLAVEQGNDKCMDLLIKAGADLDVADSTGHTALMFAAREGYDA